jgi:carboxyl-terminal processing protease
MKKIFLNFLILITCTFVLTSHAASKNKETYEYLDLFGQIFDRVRSGYVEEVTDEELIEKAIDGMLTGLDPHSGYMNEEVWQEMQTDTKGKFGGLGIEITMEEGFVKVISPIEDTPAYEAGVKAGDYIVQIDATPVFGLSLNEAVDLMRGKKGSPITITVSREGVDPFEIKIIRDIIKIQSVKSDIFNDIGYLRITSFTEQTESGLIKSIKKIKEELSNKEIGYILDLRSNPGGLLKQAVKVTDIFLEKGEIVSTRGRKKIDMQRYQAKSGDLIDAKPLIVIINGGSASASEIVAGALQDHKRAIIIGTKSFGKGSVQTIIPFKKSNDKMAGIRLTTARYYTPSGESIQGKGIDPDIIVEQGSFESAEYKSYSESDLKGSLDNEKNESDENTEEISPQEKRLAMDFQLAQAVDLMKGLNIYQESFSQ